MRGGCNPYTLDALCEEVVAVDTVKVFAAGSRYVAEVDVVLPIIEAPLQTCPGRGQGIEGQPTLKRDT